MWFICCEGSHVGPVFGIDMWRGRNGATSDLIHSTPGKLTGRSHIRCVHFKGQSAVLINDK